ncbi:uncharacterized protein LOC143349305 [Colletes latitarsis]|uniref:uncharacterized protein LOC143349304 n=1 Tax=Colletes latitarsis TaxID=2605962 RepID=UPI00403643F1
MEMETLAKKYQQSYYEYVPDWLEYNSDEYDYIKQNIGFALFGLPETNKDEVKINQNETYNGTMYDKESCKRITAIYNKIIKYGTETNLTQSPISIGIIYNTIFKYTGLSKSEGEKCTEMYTIPVFKIKRMNSVWYIDNNARIYKNWNDYLTNNTLPKCVMVVPKDGIYQCDPNCEVTEQFSVVWTETLNSPACSRKNIVFNAFDTVSSALSLGTSIGLGVTSLFTPVGPVLVGTGIITAGVSGAWTIARSSQKLVDRGLHKESVHPMDKNTISAWLGITGTALTLGASGGTMLLSKVIEKGNRINTATKAVYNSMILGNLAVNGIGVIYQGCRVFDKYQEKRKVDLFDIIIFSSHVLFFSNSVLTAKLANDLVRLSNGTILERSKNTLRYTRFFKEFNRLKGVNGDRKLDLVYPVKHVTSNEDFFSVFKRFELPFKNNKVLVNGMELIDPIAVARHLPVIGKFGLNFVNCDLSLELKNRIVSLKSVLVDLLKNFYLKRFIAKKDLNNVNCFNDTLEEISHMENGTDILKMIFKVGVAVLQYRNNPEIFLYDVVHFVWEYSKANLYDYFINACSYFKDSSNLYNALTKIVTYIFNAIDDINQELYYAFKEYTLNKEH